VDLLIYGKGRIRIIGSPVGMLTDGNLEKGIGRNCIARNKKTVALCRVSQKY
jgi:hypothetical protein